MDDDNAASNLLSPTVLVVNNNQVRLSFDSLILTSLNQVHLSILAATKILLWVQQHQPDLIVLELEWFQIIELELIAALRLDWLTRNIPILVIASSSTQQPLLKLDYDACLIKPYSTTKISQVICSLISTPVCRIHGDAV